MIDSILPTCVAAAETWHDLPATTLFPEESHLVSGAVEKRRLEFATARICAHRALARLGLEPAPVGMGAHGEPLWPRGVVGSLTHCDGYRAAAVARGDRLVGLGIDAEPHRPLPPGLLEAIAGPGEIQALAELGRSMPDIHWDRLAFSAKESVYKAWFPLTGRRPGFHDAHLALDPRSRTFSARLEAAPRSSERRAGRRAVLAGRWLTSDRHILTAVALSAAPR